jgi:hypothetical protein
MRAPAVSEEPAPPPPPPHRPPNFALRRAIVAVAVVVALVVAALTLRLLLGLVTDDGAPGDATPAPTSTAEPAPTTTTTTTTTVAVAVSVANGPRHNDLAQPPEVPARTPPVRTVSPIAPLRLWTIGDSTAQALGRLLEANFQGNPSVSLRTIHQNSTGLTRQDFYDWPAALPALLAEGAPDAVVVSLGDNDAQALQPQGSSEFVDVGSPRWIEEYSRRLAAFVDQLTAAGARVYVVGQPVMRDPGFDGRIAVVDSAYRALAAANPGITYIDSRALLGDDAGAYTDTLPGPGGPVTVRNSDGIHLSLEGARWMARVVGRVVAADYAVTAP